ncbi:2-amino-4-hydroxy-6-hydroxymethyldihydropteridine diphosphokinase [Pseudolactococcus paracarnosus]|uniref:2-amino-4-hydroxy-6-hydroxymethyldihydropteridine diphosphokinase n=1 Tax=Pseudolactococcus paracarnosus TaxID=2749962 RepID=A0A7L4WF26_9LACT|nr:2-amino-4-hydroxy-6-hydroxymethyldihydropteridine diphosphokinase [Lactococcus paracarnosus]SPC37415.1 2-amino-4-hydroxy-6-hydroxymethyldihydropteridinepyrophosphokinase [Lactococcus piscium]MCJ1976785.1 2-amino-4-hydroxy-6-hydroxymethyldihydropteridine diphosphokinase [Lactococcus paracarnosus]MCJ1982829.1 2-amino-4-hydroxy-6-hydroxymethyldihydropteridine diphosphokinase [Lactococcus paracarnosus]MCJ1993432.1 2-amino-4-hydroxy-6-hydroxymethyldihydropteridine diphosphokinase [Lactococcus par
MPKVYLSIGTNMGDKLANLQTAVDKLAALYAISAVSKVYETQPVGEVVQDDFYNIAICLTVPDGVAPTMLLAQTQQIEKEMKRIKTIHWGPRTIDLDILRFGDVIYQTETLTIPHIEMANRRFVLQPLLDAAHMISDSLIIKQTEQLLKETSDHNWVRPVTATIQY